MAAARSDMSMEDADAQAELDRVVSTNTYEWLRYQDEPHYDGCSQYSLGTVNSIGKWTARVWQEGLPSGERADALPCGRGLEEQNRVRIEYSVFQPSIKTGPTPRALDTGAAFEAVVQDCVDAISVDHFELRRIEAGSSGSYFAHGTDGSIRGVFKPKDEEPYGPFSPKWTKWFHRTFFPCFFGRSCLIPNLGYICEAAASLMDRRLRVGLVPHTDVVLLDSTSFYDARRNWLCGFKPRVQRKIGSFQLFLNDYVPADEFLNRHPLPGMYTDDRNLDPSSFNWNPNTLKQFRLQLERLMILDYVMRNTDRGPDNWMVNVSQSDDGSWRIKLAAIDNGLAFPWKHPDEWRSFPYGWLFLPVSLVNRPFSKETREHFLPILLNTRWWEDTYLEFTQLFKKDSEFKSRLWRKQWSVLKGQAFNIVETLKDTRCGPLELVKRTPCLVFDGLAEHVFYPYGESSLSASLAESLPMASSPMVIGSFPDDETAGNTSKDVTTEENAGQQPTTCAEHPTKKTVIIERLEICNSKPPLFTWW